MIPRAISFSVAGTVSGLGPARPTYDLPAHSSLGRTEGDNAPQGTSRKPETGPDPAEPPSVLSLIAPSSPKQLGVVSPELLRGAIPWGHPARNCTRRNGCQ